jgi:hypothetical protein
MATVTVDLRDFPRFWEEFASRGSAFDLSAIVTSERAQEWLLEWYGIDCRILPGSTFGTVLMSPENHTAFLLRWA